MIKAKDNQTLFDLAIKYSGALEIAFSFAHEKNLSITDDVHNVEFKSKEIIDERVVDYFFKKNLTPASADDKIVSSAPDSSTVYVLYVPGSKKAFYINDNQTLFDYALQHSGAIEGAFIVAHENKLSVTEDIVKNTPLNVQEALERKIVDFYKNRGNVPASAASLEEESSQLLLEGIGYWAIGVDFVVS